MANADDIMNVVGTIGGFAISLSLVPQVYLTYKTKCADDISFLYQGIYILGTSLVNSYAIYFGLYAVYIPCLLEFCLIVTLTIMKIVYPKREDVAKELEGFASRHSVVYSDGTRASLTARKSIRILKQSAPGAFNLNDFHLDFSEMDINDDETGEEQSDETDKKKASDETERHKNRKTDSEEDNV